MHIVKDLNDYKLNRKQRVFVDFIADRIGSYCSCEKIKNAAYLRKYVTPVNEFVTYNNATPSLAVRRLKINQQKSTY